MALSVVVTAVTADSVLPGHPDQCSTWRKRGWPGASATALDFELSGSAISVQPDARGVQCTQQIRCIVLGLDLDALVPSAVVTMSRPATCGCLTFILFHADDEVCRLAASSGRTALTALVQCVPPPAACDGTHAFPLAAALSSAKPSSSLEARQQAQSQLLTSLRVSVASELCAQAETLAAFAAPLMSADAPADIGPCSGVVSKDGDVGAVLRAVLACCAADTTFCERAASIDLHEVRPSRTLCCDVVGRDACCM